MMEVPIVLLVWGPGGVGGEVSSFRPSGTGALCGCSGVPHWYPRSSPTSG